MVKRKPTIARTMTLAELSEQLSLNEDSIKRHIRRGAPSSKRNGRLFFNLEEYAAWMKANNLTGKRGTQKGADSPDLAAAKLRKENALAAKHELSVAQAKRELLPTEEVRQWVFRHFGAVRVKLMNLGDEIGPRLVGRQSGEIAEAVNERVRQILTELADAAEGVGK